IEVGPRSLHDALPIYVEVDGERVDGLGESARSRLRNQRLGFVYQFHHLLPEFSAVDNVAMPLIVRRESRRLARERAREVLAQVRSEEHTSELQSRENP